MNIMLNNEGGQWPNLANFIGNPGEMRHYIMQLPGV